MPDLDPVTKQTLARGFVKLISGLWSQFGSRLIRQDAAEAARERLFTARATVEEQKILVEGDYDIKEIKALREHQLRTLKKDLAQPKEDIIDIDIVWEPEPEALALPANQRSPFEHVEQKRLRNIKNVTREAIGALPEHKEISDEPVDPDWFARFFDNIKDISQEEMQKLWGRLLAGEIATPGRFSYRTLDVLRNLTSTEAQLFDHFCSYVASNTEIIFPADAEFVKALELRHEHLLRLIDCGLLYDAKEVSVGGFVGRPEAVCRFRNKVVRLTRGPDNGKIFVLHVFRLTSPGRELATLIPRDTDTRYIDAFCAAAQREGQIVDVSAHTPDAAAGGSPVKNEGAHSGNP